MEDVGRNVCSHCVGGLTCKCPLNHPPHLGLDPKPVAISGRDRQGRMSPSCCDQSHWAPDLVAFGEGESQVNGAKDNGHFILFFNQWHRLCGKAAWGGGGQDGALSQVPASRPGPAVFEIHPLVCPMGTISAVTGTRVNPPASCISLDKVLALVAITKVGGFEHYVVKAGAIPGRSNHLPVGFARCQRGPGRTEINRSPKSPQPRWGEAGWAQSRL